MKIKGGYYIKARCIQDSEISIMPPYIREIWDWLLKEANHSDNKSNGLNIKRGQLIRTFKDIQEGLHWMIGWRKMTYQNWQCENAMKFLRERSMITTMKTTRGMLITICKYSLYQDPKNYESNSKADRRTTVAKQTPDTINKNDNNDKNEIMKKEILSSKLDLEAPILYLNEKAKRKFDSKLSANRDLVKARYNEGRSLGDFKQVINKKVSDWLSDEKMMKYLRPSTLFNRVNFENYLNEPTKTINTDDESQPKWEKKEIIKLTPEQVARDKVRLKELANQVKRIGNMPGTAKGGIK